MAVLAALRVGLFLKPFFLKYMKQKEQKKTSIGGQAVIEGVMMRGKSAMATCVRDTDGVIRTETKRVTPTDKKNLFFRLPIVRGILAFVNSLVGGTKTLLRSAEVFGEEEPSRFEKWLSKKFKIDLMSVITTFSLIIGIGLAIFLFLFLPQYARVLIEKLVGNDYQFGIWARNFIEGGFKLLIFISYILLCSLIKDVRRTFMYHGAEHKTISCYEKGLPLTIENARKCPRVHDRCGTTFIVFVMVISIIVFACFEALFNDGISNKLLRILCKISLLPVVAGLSYELLKGLSKTNLFIFYPLKVPGLLLQRITTKEPDDDMLEVAIKAFNTVLEMDNNPEIKEVQFVVARKTNEYLQELKKKLRENGVEEDAEAEWIVSIVLGVKRDQLNTDKLIRPVQIEKIEKIVSERITGRPLWYCIGDADFYGYKINVDERVLIPRPETELLIEQAKKVIKPNDNVLDLCTGSGCIAIALKKEIEDISVTAVDVSSEAIELASNNANINQAEIQFIVSDMFNELENKAFDVIISNPPYINSKDILSLQKEVKDFEPTLALDGGKDGLDFYRIIAKNVKTYLKEKGVLLLECGVGQAQEIEKLFLDVSSIEIIKDYEGIDRIVKVVL